MRQFKNKTHWANINETSFVFGMKLLFWVFRILGRWPFRVVLYPVLLWYVIFKPFSRRASQAYLQHIHNYVPQSFGWFGVLQHFSAFAESILDKMLLWGGLFDVEKVQYFGQTQMSAQLGEKQGALLVCSHLGNLEMCRVLSRQYPDVKLTVLVHTKHARAFNRMLGQLDPRSQMDLLQVTEITPATAIMLAEKIAQGGFIVIAGDRIPVAPNPRVAYASFLGQKAAFPIGPYVLASVLQCPIYLLFSLHINSVPQVHFELLQMSVKLPRKGRDEILQTLVANYALRLEHYCLQAPLQWFNFYNFWHLPSMESDDVSY